MKIRVKDSTYEKVMAMQRPKHRKPLRPSMFFRVLIRLLCIPEMLSARFRYTSERMELVGKDEPCLILMNHSSFVDLEVAHRIFFPRPLSFVCTSDAFVGLHWILHLIGAIPTNKFVTDVQLIGDMQHALRENRTSVLMYPEASYTFDGTATPLPRKMGVLLKKLKVPVVMVNTTGAFSREPLYNCLQKRKNVPVTAHVRCLLTPEEIREKSVAELDAMLDEAFTFDGFAWQRESGTVIDSPTRADGLDRILYRCCECGAEGVMHGEGTELRCDGCGSRWELDELGRLHSLTGETRFDHVPHWYAWERAEVRRELEAGEYLLDTDVDICAMVNYKAIYRIGSGHLRHDSEGFRLTGCDGQLDYTHPPLSSYSLYADYYWYEIGDVICIGNNDVLYYCFPKGSVPVAKTRLAAEELYKMKKQRPARRAKAETAE